MLRVEILELIRGNSMGDAIPRCGIFSLPFDVRGYIGNMACFPPSNVKLKGYMKCLADL